MAPFSLSKQLFIFTRLIAASFIGAAGLAGAAERTAFKFDFGPGKVAEGFTAVSAEMLYSVERGYGFEPGAALNGIDRSGEDPVRSDFFTSDKPFLFSVKVPEGNYRVTVTLGDSGGPSVTTIKAETRRLMVEKMETSAGQFAAATFIVNIRNAKVPAPPTNAPGNDHVELNDRENGPRGLVPHWDDKLTLEFNGTHPCVCAVEIEKVDDAITVFLVGDSTVTDQPGEPSASWGQMLPRFFQPPVAIANHAESGETLKSFITELRFDKVLSQVKRGDYLFIQFGHNDSKINWPQTYVEPFTTYAAYLKVYIAEARRRGVTPVLVTSMQRRQFDAQGKIRNSHGDFPAAVRRVAEEEKVPLIDLEAMSVKFYESLGPEKSPLAFANGGRDVTHHNNYGAYELAKCVVEGIKASQLELAKYLVPNLPTFDPAQPDAVETWTIPASPIRMTQTPRGS